MTRENSDFERQRDHRVSEFTELVAPEDLREYVEAGLGEGLELLNTEEVDARHVAVTWRTTT